MKNLPLIGLACVGTAYGLAVSLPANAANLNSNDSCFNNSNCTEVYTELAIILDGSDSIRNEEFEEQLTYYQQVFSSPNFYEQIIKPLDIPQMAVSVFQFGSKDGKQVQQDIGWTLLDSQDAADAFADLFAEKTDNGYDPKIQKMGGDESPIGTSIAEAHNGRNGNSGLEGLRNNAFAGNYLIMDISSDGYEWFPNISWATATINAKNDNIDAINGISIDPNNRPGFVPEGQTPILDNIVSLTYPDGTPLIDEDTTWNNPSDTEGFLTVTGSLDNYKQLLSNKIAQETLPADTFDPDKDYLTDDDNEIIETVPEPSLLWGILGIGCLGLLGNVTRSE